MYNKTMNRLLCVFIVVFAFWAVARADEKVQFELVSPAFTDNSEIPPKFTCHGSDINPPLEFKNVPHKTKSFALSIHDPDAPEGVWVHWVVYNIKPATRTIAENTVPGHELFNDFGKYHYRGPCPVDEKEHHYIIRAYALDQIMIIDEGSTMKEMEQALRGHILAQAKLTGVYRKPVW